MKQGKRPVLLVIRDGWGENHNPEQDRYNAIKIAHTPVSDKLSSAWPRCELAACGEDVGVPDGVMGNSEVGHQNIGAGRVVDQEVLRISKAFRDGRMGENETLRAAFAKAKSGGKLHLMGLVSDAGVHGLLEHLYGLLREAKDAGVERVFIHAFTDGRDTPPKSGKAYIERIEAKLRKIGVGQIASVCGRFWSMDRDNRWDRVAKAYHMLVGREAEGQAASAAEALESYYENPLDSSREGDEFVTPTWVTAGDGKPVGPIEDGDAVVFWNYRGDRPRELVRAFLEDGFDAFGRGPKRDLYFATMTDYQKGLCPNVVFPKPPKMKNILGAVLADRGKRQFRCAETEKYPHVTFFFNDYREEPFEGEDREMPPSPSVNTYDQAPEMAAEEVMELGRRALRSGKYDFLLINFANPDMVGHTGKLEAVVNACETVDACLGQLLEAVDEAGGAAVVAADHGNGDLLWDEASGGPHTAHTLNPVELVVYGRGCRSLRLRQEDNRLADIAPTVLQLMGLDQPREMTGRSLIEGDDG